MGFLSNLLPAIAGGALAATGVGAPAAAAMLGGLQYARTGSLNKGLMAGMGAYGGAGLAGGLAGAAATTVPESAQLAAGAGDPTAGIGAMSGADKMAAGVQGLGTEAGRSAFMQNVGGGSGLLKTGLAAAAPAIFATPERPQVNPTDANIGQRYKYDSGLVNPTPNPSASGQEQRYYTPSYTKISDAEAKSIYGYAGGGDIQTDDAEDIKADPLAFFHARQAQAAAQTAPPKTDVAGDYDKYLAGMKFKAPSANPTVSNTVSNATAPTTGYMFDPTTHRYTGAAPTQQTPAASQDTNGGSPYDVVAMAGGGPVEAMSNANAIGANTGFPQADVSGHAYATPTQTPVSQNVVQGTADTGVNSMTGEQNEFARGGLSSAAAHLGDYSDGGRLLKGPGDGVSDSIPATIGNKRPARLADNEFVIPARIVSEIGNGSTDAGARKLYAMLDRVQAARKKSIGKGKVAVDSKAYKALDKL